MVMICLRAIQSNCIKKINWTLFGWHLLNKYFCYRKICFCVQTLILREYSIIFIVLWWIRRLKLFCGTFIYLAWPTFNFFSTKSNHNYNFKKINILRNIADVCFYFFFILQEKNTTESVTYINARLLTTPIIISS